jgi:hypothetical protein
MNIDSVIKKILLNINYDTKKTLSENRYLINENTDCVPLDAQLTSFVSGNDRSTTYPELGKWGDGKCLCVENKSCLEYKEECCKKLNVSVGDAVIFAKSADGKTLVLPKRTKIVSTFNKEYIKNIPIEDYAKTSPLEVEACNTNKPSIGGNPYNLYTCLEQYKNKIANTVVNNSVHTFEIDGKKWSPCYGIRTGTQGTYKYYNVDNFKPHTGYGSPCNEYIMWTEYLTKGELNPYETQKGGSTNTNGSEKESTGSGENIKKLEDSKKTTNNLKTDETGTEINGTGTAGEKIKDSKEEDKIKGDEKIDGKKPQEIIMVDVL